MIKEKKLERIGNYREDGKRYKLRSIKNLSEDYSQLAQKVEVLAEDPVIKMYFRNPTWPPTIQIGDYSAVKNQHRANHVKVLHQQKKVHNFFR